MATAHPLMQKLIAASVERSVLRDRIAQMLYEHGDMLADHEDGCAPAWNEVVESSGDHADILFDHRKNANAIMGLDAVSCLELGRILMGIAATKYEGLENDLWAKIERAKGYECGSLRGWPGVKQKVAI